jgi:hypothetical protein
VSVRRRCAARKQRRQYRSRRRNGNGSVRGHESRGRRRPNDRCLHDGRCDRRWHTDVGRGRRRLPHKSNKKQKKERQEAVQRKAKMMTGAVCRTDQIHRAVGARVKTSDATKRRVLTVTACDGAFVETGGTELLTGAGADVGFEEDGPPAVPEGWPLPWM